MNELEQLRSLIAGASTASELELALAYLAAARSAGRKLHAELKAALLQIEAIETRWVKVARGEQVPLVRDP